MRALLLLLLLGTGASQAVRPAPPRPGLSWKDADSLARKLEAIERRSAPGAGRQPAQTVQVTQAELNSYLNLSLAPQLPPGLSELDVRLERERVAASAVLDLDRLPIKLKDPASPWNPLNFLGGRVPLELRGKLTSDGGFGSFAPEQVRLASVPLPPSLLAQLVAGATRTRENPRGFDILSPFRLPYAAKRVRLQPGRAFLEF
jgi:hypothetical protein